MSFAVRNDGLGYRRVDGPSDLLPDEWLSPQEPPATLPSTADLLDRANIQRDALLALATLRIAPLQGAVTLGMANAAEVESLEAWTRYQVLVNRVSEQDGFPETVEWPPQPD